MPSAPWTSISPCGGLLPFWCHPENHDMRLAALVEDEGIVTSPFVLLSEEETLLALPQSKVLPGICVKTTESGREGVKTRETRGNME